MAPPLGSLIILARTTGYARWELDPISSRRIYIQLESLAAHIYRADILRNEITQLELQAERGSWRFGVLSIRLLSENGIN